MEALQTTPAAETAPWPDLPSLLDFGFSPEDVEIIRVAANGNVRAAPIVVSPDGQAISSVKIPVPALVIPDLLQLHTDLNQVFRAAFGAIRKDGFLICRVETLGQRKRRIFDPLPAGIRQSLYAGDYLLHRITPRVYPVKVLYRRLFPSLRTISRAEVIGRLYYAGFSVNAVFESGNRLVIVAQRPAGSFVEKPASSEGVLLRMARVGQGGKLFNVYKFRTMHPYSEHLQEYLIRTSGLEAGGKFRDDFRITTVGRLMRKYWIDEIPMVINLLKGDMKLIGVRPISAHYLSLYPESVRNERVRYKPGLLPPYYADLPRNFDEIVESERRYLAAFAQAPFKTDLRYFLKIGYNIFWKRARSK
ncbi:sugar transferase [Larkinella soli]|uniref:sugar transferase n=1 Tax=Larkinella soli TaxID=1770527 RepID=UPI000FFC214D|nr:sugar transferase [Larkinella soli]